MIDPASTQIPVANAPVTRFTLTGDVMLGRGIDQILPHPSPAILHEPFAKSALLYVSLAEKRNGAVPRPVPYSYVWGDAIEDLAIRGPDLRIINLETAITKAWTPAPLKGIHYRMNPANLPVLQAAGIDCCVLANNHVLDWGRAPRSGCLHRDMTAQIIRRRRMCAMAFYPARKSCNETGSGNYALCA